MSEPLDILLIESEPGAGDSAADKLTDAGHRVHRCHHAGDTGWACVGLTDPAACPLDQHVDAAVVVRAPGSAGPTPHEDGVRCAIRSHVPLVGVGFGDDDVFSPWMTLRTDERALDAACYAAVDMGHLPLVDAVMERIANLVSAAGLDVHDTNCRITTRWPAMRVVVTLPHGADHHLEQAVGVRAYDALRSQVSAYSTIDVAVGAGPDGHDLLAGLVATR